MADVPGYTPIPTTLIHRLIIAIISAIVIIGGYMILWDRTDRVWKAKVDINQQHMRDTIALNLENIQTLVREIRRDLDIKLKDHPHPQLDLNTLDSASYKWRLDLIEKWIVEHDKEHQNNNY